MPSTVKSSGGGSFELVPQGTHIGRCIAVVNLGLQETGWGPKNKHWIGFEIPSVRVEWDKDDVHHEGPALIGNRYTSSLSDKAILRQHLESWRGKKFTEAELDGFDLFKLLGVPCMLSVTHTDDGKYANISSIMGLPTGTIAPEEETPRTKYDPSEPNATELFETLPDWQKKLIKNAVVETENPEPAGPDVGDGQDFDDSSPF